jgi:DMSO/TMAO reductase YedYZ molybdopterin-dependent catalytic subunit
MKPDPPQRPTETPRDRLPLGRAAFLGTVAVGMVGVAAFSKLGGIGVGQAIGNLGSAVPGLDGIVPTNGWRIYNVQDPMPTFDPGTYTLTIDGEVDNPVVLAWNEIQALPMTTEISDFHCVTGWSVNDVQWRGFKPQTVMDLAKPRPSAQHVTFQSLEAPYFDQLTLEQFLLPEVMLATDMEGSPLTRPHGSPLRLVVPPMYGYKGVKWLGQITFTSELKPGYWQTRGYAADAWVGTDAYR